MISSRKGQDRNQTAHLAFNTRSRASEYHSLDSGRKIPKTAGSMANQKRISFFKTRSAAAAIGFSLALHVCILASLLYFSKLQQLRFSKNSPLTLELSPDIHSSAQNRAQKKSEAPSSRPLASSASAETSHKSKLSLQNRLTSTALGRTDHTLTANTGELFLPEKSWQKSKLIAKAMTNGRGESEVENWGDPKTEVIGRMNSMGLNEVLETQGFYQEIWRKIENELRFPDDLVNARLAGLIYVEAQVNHRGQLVGQSVRVRGADAVLQSLALATTIAALNEPLPKNLWTKEDTVPIGLYFDFRYTLDPEQELEGLKGQTKNLLHFFRYGHATPILSKLASKLPIIPVPGLVLINFARIYEIIHDWDKPSEDELRQIRLDLFKKKLHETIESSSQTSS